MQTSLLDVVIIGAGPAGLIMADTLKNSGKHFVVLDRGKNVGGIWDIDANGSPMYESAHFISSKTLSGFPGFPIPDEFPDYPSHRQIFQYIKDFADARDLTQYVRFHSEVERAEQDQDGIWTLSIRNQPDIRARYLVCANGVTWIPNTVSWPGKFNGQIIHSNVYRSASQLADKRVLVVGAGNSGVDIACDAAFSAKKAVLSMRRGYHVIPKHIMGMPSDVFNLKSHNLPFRLRQLGMGVLLNLINGRMSRYGLPEPDHKVLETHPIMNSQILHYLSHGDCIAKPDVKHLDGDKVFFTDGSNEEIDVLITATGYKHCAPFLPDGFVNERNGRPDLYLNMFPRERTGIAFLGFIEFASAAYSNFARMARLIAEDIRNPQGTLTELKHSHYPDLKGGKRYVDTTRNANYVDVDTYLKQLNKLSNDMAR